MVCLGNADVQRNPVVKQILDIYQPATKVPAKVEAKNVAKNVAKVEAKNVAKPAAKVADNDAALIPKQHIRPTIFDN